MSESPRIAGDSLVVELLERFPQTEEVMVSYGFMCVGNAALRQVIPRTLTVESAAHIHGVNLEALLEALNLAAERD